MPPAGSLVSRNHRRHKDRVVVQIVQTYLRAPLPRWQVLIFTDLVLGIRGQQQQDHAQPRDQSSQKQPQPPKAEQRNPTRPQRPQARKHPAHPGGPAEGPAGQQCSPGPQHEKHQQAGKAAGRTRWSPQSRSAGGPAGHGLCRSSTDAELPQRGWQPGCRQQRILRGARRKQPSHQGAKRIHRHDQQQTQQAEQQKQINRKTDLKPKWPRGAIKSHVTYSKLIPLQTQNTIPTAPRSSPPPFPPAPSAASSGAPCPVGWQEAEVWV